MCERQHTSELRSLVHSALEVSSSGEQESLNLFLPPLGQEQLFRTQIYSSFVSSYAPDSTYGKFHHCSHTIGSHKPCRLLYCQ